VADRTSQGEADEQATALEQAEEAEVAPPAQPPAATPVAPAGAIKAKKWPVLRQEDGGSAVHHLQVLLMECGYNCEEDECRYWFFGPMTENALRTYQACNDLADTGCTDYATWELLLGPERWALGPATLDDPTDGCVSSSVPTDAYTFRHPASSRVHVRGHVWALSDGWLGRVDPDWVAATRLECMGQGVLAGCGRRHDA